MKNYKWGVELEMCVPYDKIESFRIAISRLHMNVSGDGSVSAPSGYSEIEIKTSPLTTVKMTELIPKIASACAEYGCIVNKTTGFHIHTSNRGFFGLKRLRHILLTWLAIEDVLFATQPESRLASRYCQRRLYDMVKKNGLPKLPAEKDELVSYLGSEDRYYALNIASLHKHGTLEVRLHSGTIDAQKMQMWMELIRHIYDFALCSWDAKTVKTLFETKMSEEKVGQVWELLKLPKEIRSFYNKRIQKFLIPKLAQQHDAAQKIMSMNVSWDRVQKRMREIQEEYRTIDNQRQRLMTVFGR